MDEKVEFTSVYSTFDRGTAALIKSLFESNSINYYVDNEHAASLAVGQVTGIMTFMVEKKQLALAEELLKDLKN